MGFGSIHSAADPEEFCREVQVEDDQELRAVDDQHAEVVYTDGVHRAFTIAATPAHDAEGSAVPTSIAVTGPHTVVLTVHHRAGNPLKSGEAFDYPVVEGVGWEGGFVTHIIAMPKVEPQPEAPAAQPDCVVPRLREWKLKAARHWLRQAQCGLGKVRGKRRPGAKVVKQSPAPGTELPAGARVAVKLG